MGLFMGSNRRTSHRCCFSRWIIYGAANLTKKQGQSAQAVLALKLQLYCGVRNYCRDYPDNFSLKRSGARIKVERRFGSKRMDSLIDFGKKVEIYKPLL
ncbi:hypothetical protein NRIC_09310 [Enterococcus florum]|uniref:Uncharacterized protein n=1 Tax=Enterococcus florum TaxID=2480627 RepID=A0A4P5P5S1_9ENTE|nr:hypothetical protein NRIC_09310 [Enterococcus florum]